MNQMRTSKLDEAAASWAMWLAKKKTSSLGFVISVIAAITWLIVYVLTQKVAYAGVALIWLIAALLQFERRGFTILLDQSTSDAERRKPNQALLPTPMSVTDRADARSAPDIGAADL